MEEKILTVEDLEKVFKELVDNGYGDMKIYLKGEDDESIPLYDDEVSYDYYNREVRFRKNLLHDKFYKANRDFANAVEKEFNKYFRKIF